MRRSRLTGRPAPRSDHQATRDSDRGNLRTVHANARAAHRSTPPAPCCPRPRPSQPSAASLRQPITPANRLISRQLKLICPIRTRLRQPADPQVSQLRGPVVGGQLVKERLAGVLVDGIEFYRQPSFIDVRREQLVRRSVQRRLFWQPDRILRLGKCFGSLVGFSLPVRAAVAARVWASRAGDGGWSGSRQGQRRPVALRPPVDGGVVGHRGDQLPAVATLRRAATPAGPGSLTLRVGGWSGFGGE